MLSSRIGDLDATADAEFARMDAIVRAGMEANVTDLQEGVAEIASELGRLKGGAGRGNGESASKSGGRPSADG